MVSRAAGVGLLLTAHGEPLKFVFNLIMDRDSGIHHLQYEISNSGLDPASKS